MLFFFPLVSIVALLAATDAIITLSQNAIWALYVGCLLRGAAHNIHTNSIHQLLEPSCHIGNTCSYFLFTAALHKHCYQVKEKYRDFYFLSQEGSNKYKHIQNPTHLQLKLQLLLLPSSLFFSSDPNVYETNKTSKIFL